MIITEGDEIPAKPPSMIPHQITTTSSTPLEGSFAISSSSMTKESGSYGILPNIHTISALVFMANESVLTAIEENKLSRIASSLSKQV